MSLGLSLTFMIIGILFLILNHELFKLKDEVRELKKSTSNEGDKL